MKFMWDLEFAASPRYTKYGLICFLSILFFLSSAKAQTGLRWRALPNAPGPTASRYDDIVFLNTSLGWVINGTGKIYRTTDGGESWDLQLDQPETYWRAIGFADSLRGWAGNFGLIEQIPRVTDTNMLYQTVNGGKTWTPVLNIPDPKPEGICGIRVVNDSVVYAVGRIFGAPRVLKTDDGGASWRTINMESLVDRLVDVYFFTADSGFVVGGIGDLESSSGRILFTSDGGDNWEIRHTTKENAHWCWKISFPTAEVGYISLETFSSDKTSYFLKTTDGGLTWEEKLLFGGFREQGIGFVTETLGWVGGAPDTYETTDGGESWTQIQLFNARLNRIRMLSDTLGYAVGATVYKYSRDNITSVEPVKEAPETFLLAQNYPNPFNPTTQINYSLQTSAIVSLKIYDLLGNQVQTLVEAFHLEGMYSVTFDAGGLASGVYFYKLEAGDFGASKKMLLIR